jgi:hypothetical protein
MIRRARQLHLQRAALRSGGDLGDAVRSHSVVVSGGSGGPLDRVSECLMVSSAEGDTEQTARYRGGMWTERQRQTFAPSSSHVWKAVSSRT